MLGRYKEIIYGVLLGFAMWVVDAAMHTQLVKEASESGHEDFWAELLAPDTTPLLFRGAFMVIAVAFGWALWRANMNRQSAEQRAQEHAVEAERLRAIVAIINTFRHEVNDPLGIITLSAGVLSPQMKSAVDRETLNQIEHAAFRISSLIEQLARTSPLYFVDVAGTERIAYPAAEEHDESRA